jgi:L-ribulose-5-phosphate 3-epimerase
MEFKIGVIIKSLKLNAVEGIKKAAQIGASGIQIHAVSGETAPENLNMSKRKELLDIIKSNGLEVAAVCGDLGGHGFSDQKENAWRIEKSKRIMDLAKELETDIITTHIGVIPKNSSHPRWQIMQEACEKLGEYADSLNAIFAIETGPETADELKGFLDSLKSNGVRVNMDPANLVMVTGENPKEAVYKLSDYIVHTHAKDGIMMFKKDPEVIYGIIEDTIKEQRAFKEVPLGEGDVHFPSYLKALSDIGYNGYLTIEREVGDEPIKDIQKAVSFLRDTMNLIQEV